MFENYTSYAIKQWMQVPLAIKTPINLRGIRNQESFIRGNLQYMQFTKGYIQFLL